MFRLHLLAFSLSIVVALKVVASQFLQSNLNYRIALLRYYGFFRGTSSCESWIVPVAT